MLHIPLITLVLWLFLVAGFWLFPGILLKEYVEYPLIIVLSVLLPVSFWLTQQETRTRYRALLFAGIFLFDIGISILGLAHNYAVLASTGSDPELKILPEMTELLTTEKDPGRRRIVAQIFYRKYGVSVPYRLEANGYALYLPDQKDKERYRANSALAAGRDVARMNLSTQIMTLFFLLTAHAGIFFLVIVFLLLYERQKPSAGPIGPGYALNGRRL